MAQSVRELVRGSELHMKFIDYHESYWDDNKEFLRGDMWEFKFLNAPKIVYFPGDDIPVIKVREENAR